MPLKKLFTLFIFVLLYFGANAQELVTDRPDQTESSCTVPLKSFQIETGFLLQNEKLGSEKQLFLPTTLFRYGLSRTVELRLGEQLIFQDNNFSSETNFGIGDLELGAKVQILKRENANTEIAFLSHVVLPIATDGLSVEKVGVINKIAISHPLTNALGFGYNIGYNYFGEGNGDLTYSSVFGIAISENIGTYAEVYGELVDTKEFVTNFDAGLTYLLKPNFQIDFSFGLGINQKMNYFAVGFSWNINANGES